MRTGIITILAVLLLSGFCLFAFSFADEVVLENGNVIEGTILEETPEYVKIDSAGVPLTYYSPDVKEVKRVPVSEEEKSLIKNQSVYPLLERAKQLRKENRYEEAIGELKKAVEIEPGNIMLYSNIAVLYYVLGQDEQSLIYCQKILKISPGEAHALACMALANYQLGKYAEGRELFKKFLSSFKPKDQRNEDFLKRAKNNSRLLEQIAKDPDIANKEEIKKAARVF